MSDLKYLCEKLVSAMDRGDANNPLIRYARLEWMVEIGEEIRAYLATSQANPTTYDESSEDNGPSLGGSEGEPVAMLLREILAELRHARTKFPGDNVTTLALVKEVGELAKATFEESRERVRKEGVQVAAMAMRVVLDGDSTLDAWRANKGLDPLTPTDPDYVAAVEESERERRYPPRTYGDDA